MMNIEKKMTKKDYFNYLLTIQEVTQNAELVKFINNELELLARKSAKKGNSKKSQENEAIKEQILEIMAKEPERLFTVSEVWKMLPNWGDYSNQKMSAMFKQLKEDGFIERIEDKKKTFFTYKK